jgi:hypothetical protein
VRRGDLHQGDLIDDTQAEAFMTCKWKCGWEARIDVQKAE